MSIVYTQPSSLQNVSSLESSNQFRANEIKNAFIYAFKGYRKYAWGHDEVQPVTNTTSDNYNGWGVTIIDSLDTMIIMGIEYNDSREFIKNLKFTAKGSSKKIGVFETVIRYLGGLLSAYELTKDDLFLNKSIELGNVLLPAFDTPTGIPTGMVDLVKKKGALGVNGRNSVLAEIGTLQLEFRRLSELSKNPIYLKKAQKVIDILQRKCTKLPGLYPVFINPYNGRFTTTLVTWGGLGDSFYEYLLKQHIMVQNKTSQYIDMWMLAVNTTMKKLVYTAKGFSNLTYLVQWENGQPLVEMGHLTCFAGGNFLLAGKFLNNTSLTNLGLNVTATCYNTYIGTNTTIGPEGFGWISPSGVISSKINKSQKAMYKKHGFFVTDASYILRPEVVESIFYAYRVTHDPKYQDWAWNIFKSINKFCKTSTGFSGLKDVTNITSDWNNSQQSFFFAETLKYLYLIFSNTSLISLDEWVFNTEAHPLRIGGG
ncbi:24790_t:CDS:2 [Gigaspora margarita]|uniref:alpha-1,2-Mannosidase n=1 Tax=Gigaspora margarita TaxID=4874 RepID=A0ABN7W694_GIGMA|nr:24790_t:CDS:2 [Gigaspora margarita]